MSSLYARNQWTVYLPGFHTVLAVCDSVEAARNWAQIASRVYGRILVWDVGAAMIVYRVGF